MKKEVFSHCDVVVEGDKKYRPFIEEATDKFMEYIECYYKLGFVKSIKVDVYFTDKEKNDKR